MSTKTNVRAILTAMRAASHSVSPLDIKHATTVDLSTIKAVISKLASLRYIKEHRDVVGVYFTRKPKRAEIDRFINPNESSAGLAGYFEPVACPVVAAAIGATEAADTKRLLNYFRTAPHAATVAPAFNSIVNKLKAAGLVKEHRDKPGKFFTVRAKRAVVDSFLDDSLGLAALYAARQ